MSSFFSDVDRASVKMELVRNKPSYTAGTVDGYILRLCPKDAWNSFLFVVFDLYQTQRWRTARIHAVRLIKERCSLLEMLTKGLFLFFTRAAPVYSVLTLQGAPMMSFIYLLSWGNLDYLIDLFALRQSLVSKDHQIWRNKGIYCTSFYSDWECAGPTTVTWIHGWLQQSINFAQAHFC